MKIYKIKKSNNAVVGIVSAFLIVGLIVAVLSVIQTQYVPKWMKEKESDHMREIEDHFSELNYAMNTHFINKIPDVPISTTITLGSKEMPYMLSMRSFGQIKINNDSFGLYIDGDSIYNETLGNIEYNSYNNYFINQDFIYEAGSVILTQDSGSIMFINPNIDVLLQKDINITLNIINITEVGGSNTIVNGWGKIPILTEYKKSSYKTTVVDNVEYINISSDYYQTWNKSLNSSFIRAGLNDPRFAKNYQISDYDNNLVIRFLDTDGKSLRVTINYVSVETQVLSWVQQR